MTIDTGTLIEITVVDQAGLPEVVARPVILAIEEVIWSIVITHPIIVLEIIIDLINKDLIIDLQELRHHIVALGFMITIVTNMPTTIWNLLYRPASSTHYFSSILSSG